ncbi:MAG: MoaD/ThiS family protein [Acidimicrobiales bacterium]|nr:MoaD/ThiS family protein [Acidimicrobiales bacterium]
MNVRLASPFRSYTGGEANVTAEGTTADDVLRDLDRRYPGIRFRIVDEQGRLRQHVNVWADGERVRDLSVSVVGAAELTVMQALSGG